MKPRRAKPLERLVDANPCWVGTGSDNTRSPNRHGIGVQFDCPIHADCLIYVPFSNPLDGGPRHDTSGWERTGDAFETLTLVPSIKQLGGADRCEWHGFIRAGRFETCADSR